MPILKHLNRVPCTQGRAQNVRQGSRSGAGFVNDAHQLKDMLDGSLAQ
jgi:hypothetical protein